LVVVALAFVLTSEFGMAGMASAVFLGSATAAACMLWKYRSLLERPIGAFFPWSRLLLLAAVALTLAALSRSLASSVLPLGDSDGTFTLAWKLAGHAALYGAAYATVLASTLVLWPGLLRGDLRAIFNALRGGEEAI
jgi:hypothetical protein